MIIKVKKCQHCGSKKNLHIQSKRENKNGTTKIYYMCRLCKVARHKAYISTPRGLAVHMAIAKKTNKKFPDKYKARYKVRDAIKTGKLLKPVKCSRCTSTSRIEGHHMDYNKPLEVIWLCTSCHTDYHH